MFVIKRRDGQIYMNYETYMRSIRFTRDFFFFFFAIEEKMVINHMPNFKIDDHII